jgi:rubrerythrin
MAGWTLEGIPWSEFDARRVDPDLLCLAKTASLVEYNSADYAAYLSNVFHDDPRFRKAVGNWEVEERRHGEALARWAAMADPSFDFEASFAAFVAAFRLPLEARQSVRGSRTGELIARCMVETGTHCYYTALADRADEPVLKAICRRIAEDEAAHYALFHRAMRRYQAKERLGLAQRIAVALARMTEIEDDELAQAFHAANELGRPYDRRTSSRAFSRLAVGCYRARHVSRMAEMMCMAVGFDPAGATGKVVTGIARRTIEFYFMRRSGGHAANLRARCGEGPAGTPPPPSDKRAA